MHQSRTACARPTPRTLACAATLSACALLAAPAARAQSTTPEALAAAPAHHARLDAATGDVRVGAGDARHAASLGEALADGDRIVTHRGGAASVRVDNGVQFRVAASSTVVLFHNPLPPRPGTARASDNSTLLRGSVRATVPDGARLVLDTPGGATVTVLPGEALVNVDGGGAVRVAVYRGRARVRSGERESAVRAGYATRAEPRRAPLPPRMVLAAPGWLAPPPAHVYGRGAPVDLTGLIAPPPPPSNPASARPAAWRQQVALDPDFTRLVSDRVVPARHTRFEVRALPPGTFYARAIGIDGEHLEGAAGRAAPIVVEAPRVVPASRGRHATLHVPAGVACGLNGATESEQPVPIPLAAARLHVLHCTGTPDGGGPFELAIDAAQTGALHHELALDAGGFTRGAAGTRMIALRLTDAAGLPVSLATVRVTASDGAAVEPLRESEVRGVYTAMIQWRAGTRGVRLHFTVNDATSFDEVLGASE